MEEFHQNFLNSVYLNDIELKREVFDEIEQLMNNSVYLKLDLTEGVHFSYDDIDEVKASSLNKEVLRALYTDNSNVEQNNTSMERWNMHTFTGKGVEPQNIYAVSVNGKISAMEVINYIYKFKNQLHIIIDMLDEFINHINSKNSYTYDGRT